MSKDVEKIQKILRLARRSNGPEAEAARRRAEEMMSARGLDPNYIDDYDVLEVVDDRYDPHRRLLAEKIAATRECQALGNGKSIAVRGPRLAVSSARDIYQTLAKHAENATDCADLQPVAFAGETARAVYRIAYWSCFAQTIATRLIPQETPQPSRSASAAETARAAEHLGDILRDKNGQEKKREAPISSERTYQDALTALIKLLAGLGYESQVVYGLIGALQDRAFADAYAAGKHVNIEPWAPRKKRAALPTRPLALPPPRA